MLKYTYKNNKFPKKQYDCFEDNYDLGARFYVYEKLDGNASQKLYMSKAQFENFELVLKTNGWSATT